MKKESSTKARLLEVCVEMIKKKPMDEISVREIAEKAGVNLASINYYFNSKESLFNAALDIAMQTEIEAWTQKNLEPSKIEKADIRNIILFLHRGALTNPSLARTRVFDLINSNKPNRANMLIYDLIFKMARAVLPGIDDNEIKIRTSLAIASIWYVSCGKPELNAFLDSSLEDATHLEDYINKVFDILFNP